MPINQTGTLKFFTFDSLDKKKVLHGIFTRHGGISPAPWSSLNLGGSLGDERDHVIENRRRIFSHFDRKVESIYDAWQVHGTEVIFVDQPRPVDSPHQKADVILTDREDITLLMRFADCVPIMLYDPQRRVVGLVHAGWRGTVARAAASAVEGMVSHYGSQPEDILAGIGPSICQNHYQVGEEVVNAAQAAFGKRSLEVLRRHQDGYFHFDLWQANRLVLEESGVQSIEQSGICTFCQNEDWFSHRAEHGKTGRFGAVIALS